MTRQIWIHRMDVTLVGSLADHRVPQGLAICAECQQHKG